MLVAKIGNSVCSVSGFTVSQLKELRDRMSYTVVGKTRYASRFGSTRKFLLSKRGDFPTGLLYILEEYARETRTPVSWNDTRVRPAMRQLGLETMFVDPDGLTPYVEQREAAEAAAREGRGIVVGPTGVGKSFIAALMLDAIQVPTLVVVPRLGLKEQLTEDLRRVFGRDRVGPLNHRGERKHFITVENVDALDPTKPAKGFDMVLVDEFHHSGADTYIKLNLKAWAGIYFKFGLTATPFRSKNEEKLLLESVLSKVIYQIPYKTAVDKGYIVPMESYVVSLPQVELKCKGNNWHAVYSECIVNSEARNAAVVQMAANLHEAGKSALILVKQVDHGLALQEMLLASGIYVPFVKGENDDNAQTIAAFNAQKISVLIGTMGVIGEGIDTKPCEYVILAGGGKSKNQFMQNCGRGFRKFKEKYSCKIVMFRDPSHKWLTDHHKACVKYLREEYAQVPAPLDLSTG